MSKIKNNEMTRWKPVTYSQGESCFFESSPSGHQIAYQIKNLIGFYDPMLMCSLSKPLIANCQDIHQLKYSPSGKILAAIGSDKKYLDSDMTIWTYNTIHLWDCINYKFLKILEGHMTLINAIDLSQDGSQIISGDDFGFIRIWNTESADYEIMDERIDLSYNKIECVKYLKNDLQFLSSARCSGIRIWSVANKVLLKQFQFDDVSNVQVHASQILSKSMRKPIYFWNSQTEQKKLLILRGYDQVQMLIANSYRSKLIVEIDYENSMMKICCTNTKKILKRLKRYRIRKAQFSPDGTCLLEVGQRTISINYLFE